MGILLIIIIGIIIYYIIFSNRDKTQDYKITAEYRSLSEEAKLKIEIYKTIEKKVNTALSLSTIRGTEGVLIMGAIGEYKKNLSNNLYDISRQYKIDPIITLSIIDKCCEDALKEYIIYPYK